MHVFFSLFLPFLAKNTQISLIQREKMLNRTPIPENIDLYSTFIFNTGNKKPAITI